VFSQRTKWNLEPNRLSEALDAHRAAGKPLLDLTASNPTKCGFQYESDALLNALRNPDALEYDPAPKGLLPARNAVAAYYGSHGIPISPDDIILATSTSEAYSMVFRVICNPGDEILIPEPSYPLFDFLADIQDVKLARYPLLYDHGWQTDFHALERAISHRTRAAIVVHPNNPTGHFSKPDEMAKFDRICAEGGMAVIADEVFLDFSLAGPRPSSFAATREALTFTMSGLSKIAGLPQMKAAWLLTSGPERIKQAALARLEVIADTYLSMNAPVQLAIPTFLAQRSRFQGQLMARLCKNLAVLDRHLAQQPACARLEVEGGWYAVLRVPVTRSDEELAIELLIRKGVYVHPGHFYDFAANGYLIVSLIAPEHDFDQGIGILLSMF
jgi:aspartate/methionine/tyrosine aminotransferase